MLPDSFNGTNVSFENQFNSIDDENEKKCKKNWKNSHTKSTTKEYLTCLKILNIVVLAHFQTSSSCPREFLTRIAEKNI